MAKYSEGPRDKKDEEENKDLPKDTGEEYQENLEELFGVTGEDENKEESEDA